jgi:hypothetical protein
MLQTYGIDLLNDVLGGLLMAAAVLSTRVFSQNAARIVLVVLLVPCAAGSASLLPTALRRGDLDILAYHSTWLVVCVVWSLWLVGRIRAHRETVRAEFKAYWAAERGKRSSAPHPGWVYESRPSGPDDTDVPVYKITTLS